MKVVAFSIKPFEKEFLAKANQKKHDITLISNPLSLSTTFYAEGKDAVIVFTNDDVSAPVIKKLADLGIKFIATRSSGTDHIDKIAAEKNGILVANAPTYSAQATAELTLALALALNRHLIKADRHSRQFDFRNDRLIGFNFSGKTVGLIGMGSTGQAVAKIFNGMGCKVIGYDLHFPDNLKDVEKVTLSKLLSTADVISLHLPLTAYTRHIINDDTLSQMKEGVMLINTSRGALINTVDLLHALKYDKVAYLGLDVYEYEKGLFFEDHEDDQVKDELLSDLMSQPNVLITPHQAYLTREALQDIANQTIKNLDVWQEKKCACDDCDGDKNCKSKEVAK
jgi:D-lactate dehydrogenase